MIQPSTAYACVIDNVVSDKGSKALMARAAKRERKAGRAAFIALTNRPIGETWNREIPTC